MTSTSFAIGMIVRSRGERFTIIDITSLPAGERPLVRLTLRGVDGIVQGKELTVLHPIEAVEPEQLPELDLNRPGRLARFRLLHDVFRLRLSPPTGTLVGINRSRIRFEPYQYVPAMRALELPRPRLLLADDVGLGKTIEAGLIIRDLAARRRASRVLVVSPAGIVEQWQEEMDKRFGLRFKIFDRDTIHQTRLQSEVGTNPWMVEPYVITSMDFIKRREGAFRELSSTRWDLVIVDEAHHLASGRSEDDVTDRYRLGRWLSEFTDGLVLLTATPHDGYDESFASLLGLLEPSLVMPDGLIRFQQYRPHLIRRLKRHILNPDGSPKFLKRQVFPIPVEMSVAEGALHEAVMAQARAMEDFAASIRKRMDAEAIRLVATILRKRAASSHAALSQTLHHRRENLSDRVEELEIQLDHVRALKRGDTIPDEALTRLEKDVHRSYLSVVRRLGKQVRRIEEEQEALEKISTLLDDCMSAPDSKMVKLMESLRAIHSDFPDDKVIIFSDYADTVWAILRTLENSHDYSGRCSGLTGDLSALEEFPHLRQRGRAAILADFASPQFLILVATDAAGEGLNLHEHCHRIIHFELPWNPNRLEQRNGRIDRYGQSQIPIIGFLYAQETYEGEVLARLVGKIERQMDRLGSVGDVLGQLQVDRIENILGRSPRDLASALREAEEEIDDEITRSTNARLNQILGDGSIDKQEIERAQVAARDGMAQEVNLSDFLNRAVQAAGNGQFERHDGHINVYTPSNWLSLGTETHYTNLALPGMQDTPGVTHQNVLQEDHPLIKAAIRWVKGSRFNREDDHRLAYALTSRITEPDLVFTFLVQVRDGVGHEQERLEAVQIKPKAEISRDRDHDIAALNTPNEGNVEPSFLVTLFNSWWQGAQEAAELEAQRRAFSWRRALITLRNLSHKQFLAELDQWNEATRRSISGRPQLRQLTLFGQQDLPPAVRLRLKHHEERFKERQDALQRQMQFDEPKVEPIGVLLRVPAKALREEGV